MYITNINDCIFTKSIVTNMNPLFPTTKKSCSQSVHSPALVNTFPPKNIELSSQDLHKIFFGQFVYIDKFIALK